VVRLFANSAEVISADRENKRWVYGVPPEGNANNAAWVQHFIHYLETHHHAFRAHQWRLSL